MATLAQEVTKICDDLSRPEDEIGAVVEREILSAIKFYSSFRFAFNERTVTTTLSATASYSFGALLANSSGIDDLLQIDKIKVTINNSRTLTLEQENWSDLVALDQSGVSSGNPDFFAIYNKTLLVYPTPNTNLTTDVSAHVLLTPLTSGDENEWLLEGEELIRSRACRMVCARKLDDFEKAQVFTNLEREALRQLQHKADLLLATGALSPND